MPGSEALCRGTCGTMCGPTGSAADGIYRLSFNAMLQKAV